MKPRMEKLPGSPGDPPAVTPGMAVTASSTVMLPRWSIVAELIVLIAAGVSRGVRPRRLPVPSTWLRWPRSTRVRATTGSTLTGASPVGVVTAAAGAGLVRPSVDAAGGTAGDTCADAVTAATSVSIDAEPRRTHWRMWEILG